MSKKEKRKPSQVNEVTEVFAALSKNPDTEGFDTQAGETWIYPTNYPLRDYQYSIIQEALLNNTMVSLPTGLGKTFIAAVVMYNFYRWYPTGKVIFMAPTRPLVKQQIDACYNIMAIPKDVTAELTGTKAQTHRKEIWNQKRVFFITPQVLQNDLNILIELGTKIKCMVFDEAHKAKGNYAYCEVIRKLLPQNKYFRVLALSATPGSSHNDVSEVIRNLLISHLEIRTDDSPDVIPYVFERSLETVVVPLGEKLQQVRDNYIQILEKYTRVLIQHRVITGNCSTLTKGKIFMTMKDYQAKSRNGRDRAYSDIMRNLNICITLYHAYELLIRHGLRGFLSFFEEHADKPLLRGNIELQQIMQDVREYLGPAPNVEPLPDGSVLDIPESSKFGHPKFYKLNEILLNHFSKANNGTESRVIVFCEYRESVMEAYALLLRQKPLIKPRIFLGQGAITQRQQINVIKAFKEGECNTLISTSIGEEGLDVGEVDLIVCFDINNKSPVRMVQRMGRTGRKREGRVVVLVTEGKEQQTLKECLIYKQNLTSHILQSTALAKEMYAQNPRMIPLNIIPQCRKLHITVTVDSSNAQPSKKRSNNLKDMFDNISNKKNSIFLLPQDCNITEILEINDRIPGKQDYWNKGNPLSLNCDNTKIDFSKKLSKLRVLQPTGKIGHTKNSELLVSLLQFAESKKYNIPMTQVPVMPSQMTQSRKIKRVLSSDGLKQTDIRNMFVKPLSNTDLTPSVVNKEAQIKEEEEEQERNFNEQMLYTEISTYLAITVTDETNCKICDDLFDCSQFITSTKEFNIKSWVEPDSAIFDSMTIENLTTFAESLKSKSNNETKTVNEHSKADINKTIVSNGINEEKIMNFEDSFKQSPFKPPKNIRKILEKSETTLNLSGGDSFFNNISFTQLTKKNDKVYDNDVSLLNVNAFEEAEFTQLATKTGQDTLTFFNITALEELFQKPVVEEETPSKALLHLASSTPHCENNAMVDLDDTIIYSLHQINSPIKKGSGSPVLCSFERVRQLKNKAHKRLFENSENGGGKNKFNNNNNVENISGDIFSEFENTFTENAKSVSKLKKDEEHFSDLDIIDTSLENCLESVTTTQPAKIKKKNDKTETKSLFNQQSKTQQQETLFSVSDIIDLSIFGLDTIDHKPTKQLNKSPKQINDNTVVTESNQSNVRTAEKSIKDCVNDLQDFCDETFMDIFLGNDPFKETNKTPKQKNFAAKDNDDNKNGQLYHVKQNDLEEKSVEKDRNAEKSNNKDANQWKEDNIWNFCLNRAENEDDSNTSTKTTATSQKINILVANDNKNNEKSPVKQKYSQVIDLTEDSPKKDLSPTLIKSQRCDISLISPFKSFQSRKLMTQDQRNTDIETKNYISTKTSLKRKLQLNSKGTKNSITSMGWYKKTNPEPSCSNKIEKIVTSITKLNSFEDETDLNESFEFTFNYKKPLTKLSTKSSNIQENDNDKITRGSKFKTTPKKIKPIENKKSPTNLNILLESDDDDFELPRKTTEWIKTRRKNLLECNKSPPLTKNKNLIPFNKDEKIVTKKKNNNKKKLEECPFIDLEAELSMDEYASSDTDCETICNDDDNDKFEESFVDDQSQNIANNTEIHAHYLQSVRSPLLNRGKFKIPKKKTLPTMNVYSQPINESDNTYMNDTFCVNTEDIELSQETKSHDISELELAELLLEQKRIEKKKRKKSDGVPIKRRRRILEYSSDSD